MTPNVLASRYASPEMVAIWDETAKVRAERRLWVTVLKAQQSAGLDVDDAVIDDYRAAVDRADLESIRERERVLLHDVKARIEEFNHLAGHQLIHLGMTSRDVTENVEQEQVLRSLEMIRDRAVAALASMARVATDTRTLVVTGRTHNVPAQATTVGKRMAVFGEELLGAVESLEDLMDRYPLRGIKGPVGTRQDQVELVGSEGADRIESEVAGALGFRKTASSVGQIYPRSLDLEVVSTLVRLASGPSNLATSLRLMAGHDLATEGFREGQVGSSAMPHKMNPRTSERIHGLKVVLGGYLTMAAGLAGEQWNEGDVACSVVRRVMLPDAFYAADGLFESLLTVLSDVGFFPAAIDAELSANLPFLATSRLLAAAVRAGSGREEAHEVIKRHAVAAARARREDPGEGGLAARLASDPEFPLDTAGIEDVLGEPLSFTGDAATQVEAFVNSVAALVERFPEAAGYRPHPLL